jgi:hypothetical protein
LRSWVEAALSYFTKISPAGAPKPRKAELALGGCVSPLSPPADGNELHDLLKFMDRSVLPIFVKDSQGRYV